MSSQSGALRKGSKQGTFSQAPTHYGGAEKSQQFHKYVADTFWSAHIKCCFSQKENQNSSI